MSNTEAVLLIAFVAACVWAIIERQDAGRQRGRAEFLEQHANAWEQRALEAEAQLDVADSRYATLQALYCEWVRKTLGQSVVLYRMEKEE